MQKQINDLQMPLLPDEQSSQMQKNHQETSQQKGLNSSENLNGSQIKTLKSQSQLSANEENKDAIKPPSQQEILLIKKIYGQFRDFMPQRENKLQVQNPSYFIIYQIFTVWKNRSIKSQNFTLELHFNSIDQKKKQAILDTFKYFASLKIYINNEYCPNKETIHIQKGNKYYEGIQNDIMYITTVTNDSQDVYYGHVKDYKEHGRGTLAHSVNNKVVWIYDGSFFEGKRQGLGKEQMPKKGISYVGEFKNDYKHGKGSQITVKKRKHPQQGQDQYVQKNRYEGQYSYGQRSGQGLQITTHGEYMGSWTEGQKNGKGIMKYKNGHSYQGQWKNNNFDGQGTYIQKIFINGEQKQNIYKGQFKQGYYHGKGVMQYGNGDKYDGQWAFGKKEGKGMYEWSDGDYYDGDWVKDSAQGQGAACFGGVFFDGQFHLGEKHGMGEETDEEGNSIKGIWQHNKLIKKLQVNGEIVEEDNQN